MILVMVVMISSVELYQLSPRYNYIMPLVYEVSRFSVHEDISIDEDDIMIMVRLPW